MVKFKHKMPSAARSEQSIAIVDVGLGEFDNDVNTEPIIDRLKLHSKRIKTQSLKWEEEGALVDS